MNLDEAVKEACGAPDLVSALAFVCVWESERVVGQARAAQKYETCFTVCIKAVMDAWEALEGLMADFRQA